MLNVTYKPLMQSIFMLGVVMVNVVMLSVVAPLHLAEFSSNYKGSVKDWSLMFADKILIKKFYCDFLKFSKVFLKIFISFS